MTTKENSRHKGVDTDIIFELSQTPDPSASRPTPQTQSKQAKDAAPIQRLHQNLEYRLYISHFLSTWNSRLFEFGAVLFLASIYPNTLMQMSIYALVRSGSAILLSQTVGSWIDRGNRLGVIRPSILWQRLSVAASCGLFWVLKWRVEGTGVGGRLNEGLFAMLVLLACVEKMFSVMNLVSIERDWVVVITKDDPSTLQILNARIRRIDLFCKLFGPLAISFINDASVMAAIWATLAMNVLSIFIEYPCIARVYKMVPALQRLPQDTPLEETELHSQQSTPTPTQPQPRPTTRLLHRLLTALTPLLPLQSLPFYLHHPALLPSLSLSLLYLTVLSFSGQMITFLLSTGYTSTHVGLARAVSTLFELSATWLAPRLVHQIGPIRGGIWFLWWQMAWLAGGVGWFFGSGPTNKIFSASGLVGGVILSRVGLWGFDLCAQSIVQAEVEEDHRGAFSTLESAFANLFELLAYVLTMVFSRPEQFRWPVVVSVLAVYCSGGLYTVFVRNRRGHLVHPPRCLGRDKGTAVVV